MPQIFWTTCPKCATKFTAEKFLWDRNDPLMCPQCREYFFRDDSPDVYAVWSPSFGDLKALAEKIKKEVKI